MLRVVPLQIALLVWPSECMLSRSGAQCAQRCCCAVVVINTGDRQGRAHVRCSVGFETLVLDLMVWPSQEGQPLKEWHTLEHLLAALTCS